MTRNCGWCLGLVCLAGSAVSATEPPAGFEWRSAVSLGAELDDRGQPQPAPAGGTKAPLRLGVSATWGLSVHWDRGQPPASATPALTLSPREQRLLEATNAARRAEGLKELTIDPVLMTLARQHSSAMAREDQLGHDIADGSFEQRMNDARAQPRRSAENVAQAGEDAGQVVELWLKSEHHRENLLHPDHEQLGLGFATSDAGKHYWTQIFAKP